MWTASAFSQQFIISVGSDSCVEMVAAQNLRYAQRVDGIMDLLLDIGHEENIRLLGFANNFCEVKRANDWQVWLGPIRLVRVRAYLLLGTSVPLEPMRPGERSCQLLPSLGVHSTCLRTVLGGHSHLQCPQSD